MAILPQYVSTLFLEKINLFQEQLLIWNKNTDLIGNSTQQDIWNRHIVNSLQLMAYMNKQDRIVLDIGTGAGFPGIVCALIDEERQYNLYEKKPQKRTFLKHIVGMFQLKNVTISESFNPHACPPADILTSRALLSIPDIVPCLNHVKKIVLFKGRNYQEEINSLKQKLENLKITIYPAYMDDSVFIVCQQ